MGLRAIFAEALPGVFTAAGEAVVYTPYGGSPVPCHAFLSFNVVVQPSGTDAQAWYVGTTVEVCLSSIGGEPKRGDTVLFEGHTYTVEALLENDGIVAKAVLS